MLDKGVCCLNNNFSNFNSQIKPQSLCKMCGKCCRVVTTSNKYEKLKKLKEEGDIGAIDFLEIFEPYDSIEDAIKQEEQTVENILKIIKKDDIFNEKDITFYRCKFLKENNLCEIYNERKELCKRFPSSAWAIVPPGCGFEDWLAEKREEIKKKVIQQKKNLLEVEELLKNAKNDDERKRIEVTRNNIKNTINAFSKYGAEQW